MAENQNGLEVIREKRNEIGALATRFGASNIRVFGSVARGDSDPGSDVDFLVAFAPRVTLLAHAALVRELEALLGRRVDVVSERALRPRVRASVEKEAVAL